MFLFCLKLLCCIQIISVDDFVISLLWFKFYACIFFALAIRQCKRANTLWRMISKIWFDLNSVWASIRLTIYTFTVPIATVFDKDWCYSMSNCFKLRDNFNYFKNTGTNVFFFELQTFQCYDFIRSHMLAHIGILNNMVNYNQANQYWNPRHTHII